MVSLKNLKRKTGGPPVYQHRLFEFIINPSYNSLDNTFNYILYVGHKSFGTKAEHNVGHKKSSWIPPLHFIIFPKLCPEPWRISSLNVLHTWTVFAFFVVSLSLLLRKLQKYLFFRLGVINKIHISYVDTTVAFERRPVRKSNELIVQWTAYC